VHPALVSQSLSIVISLIPYIRETFGATYPRSGLCWSSSTSSSAALIWFPSYPPFLAVNVPRFALFCFFPFRFDDDTTGSMATAYTLSHKTPAHDDWPVYPHPQHSNRAPASPFSPQTSHFDSVSLITHPLHGQQPLLKSRFQTRVWQQPFAHSIARQKVIRSIGTLYSRMARNTSPRCLTRFALLVSRRRGD
jgi:hypothetical protein